MAGVSRGSGWSSDVRKYVGTDLNEGVSHRPLVGNAGTAVREKALEVEMAARKIKIGADAFGVKGGSSTSKNRRKEEQEAWGEEGLEAEFSLEQISNDDYYMIKVFLKSYLVDVSFNVSELAQLIIEQKEKIGSAIVVEGQEDLFGFMTVISCRTHWEKSCIRSILKYVHGKVLNSSRYEEWKRILEDANAKLALIVSERICNLPHKLGPPMNLVTIQEVSNLGETFDYYLILTTRYKDAEELEQTSSMQPIAKRSRHLPSENPNGGASKSSTSDSIYEYYKIEDEIYREHALLEHSIRIKKFNDSKIWTLGRFTKMSKLFMIIESAQMPRILSRLKELGKTV
ncbi:uncharacterized protein LOC126323265 [Schistocerca gregaria]|uniref:uncharacterized protein LOC126323265 n=1 Tax=Schistocerca gregaria TaxID=7010 RepID=UPI00211EB182|nr:uncharacterized protein LOC126323265 [Schistocerca gregaria]